MNIETPEQLAASVTSLIALDPPPTEATIDQVLTRMANAFGVPESLIGETRKLLHAQYNLRMEMGKTLVSEEEHDPWLATRRAGIDPFYWTRYRQMLIRNGWGPFVVSTLDQTTDELLDLLGNPEKTGSWKRRGLVVGDVQSGKTASYAALICKAADAGYRMVVLLTGTLENVRRQTQERLDAAFVGLDSRDFLTVGQIGRKTHVGVGLLDRRRDGIVFTSRDSDFRKNTASALNISLGAVKEPVLVVSKKNTKVLERLAGWLRAKNADNAGKVDVPLLLIDDEADNASINTKLRPGQVTAINQGIRDLLKLFTRASYVGFTATPFANIFIDPASTSEMIGDDLFPEDFIHVLEPPNNYVGMNAIFAQADPDVEEEIAENHANVIIDIEDSETWLPTDHKKDQEVDLLPGSLKEALRCFLLATGIRDLREEAGHMGKGGGIHRSMLVNVSRFTDVQNKVATAIHTELEDIRRAVRLYGAMEASKATASSPDIAALARIFEERFSAVGCGWSEVLKILHTAISPIVVQAVNQSTGAAKLDYSVAKTAPGIRVITVGGNSLSRGLTLEGLSTSYFLRNSKMYDTLLQMGRWFGYRDGYADLCQLWLTTDATGWYRHVTAATGELKRDFARMKRRKATPKEFGLRVRCHPDTLLITARNKMATGIDILEIIHDVSLTGRGIESTRLYSDAIRNKDNFTLVDSFISGLTSRHGPHRLSPHDGALLWQDVPAADIANFIDEFAVHPLNHDFQGDSIADFLRELPSRQVPPLEHWTVALLTSGKAGPVPLNALQGVEISAKERKIKVSEKLRSILVSGKSARVGSRRDVLHGLSPAEVKDVKEAVRRNDPGKTDDVEEDHFRAAMKAPLLVIYLLKGKEPKEGTYYQDGLVLPALALHFPGASDPDTQRRLVKYRLNKVAQDELFGSDFEDEPAVDNDDDD
jgi:hypothetical protein